MCIVFNLGRDIKKYPIYICGYMYIYDLINSMKISQSSVKNKKK